MLAAVPPVPPSPPATLQPRRLGTIVAATFDPARQAVVLRYTGATPVYQVAGDGAEFALDLPHHALAVPASPDAPAPGLAGWSCEAAPQAGTRVRVRFEVTGEALVAVDASRGELLVFLQPRGAANGDGVVRIDTVVGRPSYDAAAAALAIPYDGAMPRYRLAWLGRDQVVVDLERSALGPRAAAVATAEGTPLLSFWTLGAAPRPGSVRVSMTLPLGGHLRVFDDPPRRRLLIQPRLGPAPAPPPPVATPVGQGLAFGGAMFSYHERYPAGSADTSVAAVAGLEAAASPIDLATLFPGWGLPARTWRASLGLQTASLTFQDRNLPLSLHTRNFWQAEARLGRLFSGAGWELGGGLGYYGQLVDALHSGAPPTPSYPFFQRRSVHGPSAFVEGETAPPGLPSWVGGLRLVGSARWSPWLATTIDATLPRLPGLGAAQLELGVAHPLGPFTLRAAYRRQMVFGTGFEEVLDGPYLGLSGR